MEEIHPFLATYSTCTSIPILGWVWMSFLSNCWHTNF